MSQRKSEYTRMAGDLYVTPKWVWEALYNVEPWASKAWDCAPVAADFDFLSMPYRYQDIASNPPFSLADRFCRHSLGMANRVAMLLPHTFDTAKSRIDLWLRPFKIKYILTDRIRWDNLEQKKNGPSTNHAWYVFDQNYSGPPMMGWL